MGTLFFMVNAKLTQQVPVMLLILVQSFLCFWVCVMVAKTLEPNTLVFSLDTVWGCFGFLNKEEVIESFLVFGMAAGFFGNAGYVICLKFFSPVVVSAVFLVEPLLA